MKTAKRNLLFTFSLCFLVFTILFAFQANNLSKQNEYLVFNLEYSGRYEPHTFAPINVATVNRVDYDGQLIEVALRIDFRYNLTSYQSRLNMTILGYSPDMLPSNLRIFSDDAKVWLGGKPMDEVLNQRITVDEINANPDPNYQFFQTFSFISTLDPSFIDWTSLRIELSYDVFNELELYGSHDFTLNFDILSINIPLLRFMTIVFLVAFLLASGGLASDFLPSRQRIRKNLDIDWIFFISGFMILTFITSLQLFAFDPIFTNYPYDALGVYLFQNASSIAFSYLFFMVIPFYILDKGSPLDPLFISKGQRRGDQGPPQTEFEAKHAEQIDIIANYHRYTLFTSTSIIILLGLLMTTANSIIPLVTVFSLGSLYSLWYLVKLWIFNFRNSKTV